MGIPVETPVDIRHPGKLPETPALEILLLGPVEIRRHGHTVALPRSRKLLALLAILTIEQKPVGRKRLCDLLWDRPSDPRAELRWHLSKLRQLVDDADHPRIRSGEDAISIDLEGCFVDALQVLSFEQSDSPSIERLKSMSKLFRGQFLGELDFSGPEAEQWLLAQRRRFAACRINIIKQLVTSIPADSDELEPCLERWIDLAPFDIQAHRCLLDHLVRCGRIAEADQHVVATERFFVEEGIPTSGLLEISRRLRSGGQSTTPTTPASPASACAPDRASNEPVLPGPGRSAIAVMPFVVRENDEIEQSVADGLTHDVITRLAKLRSMFIIARGSVYALAALGICDAEAGRRLNVDYVVSGSLRQDACTLRVEIELTETCTARIVWGESCEAPADNLLEALDELGNRVVAALTSEIEQAERNRAILRTPTSLDAWSAHHRGLWHMYRFTREDNARAQHFFAMAVGLDPTFSRAHAGLSFTHWQNAFQNWLDPAVESERAYAAAAQSLLADEQDPAAHWALGRALWLRKQHVKAVVALRQSVDLSPNFALGHYSLAFVESQTGDPLEAIEASNRSRELSPYDPLMFGMLGSRAMAHFRLGQFEEAADWATQAAARPNAHVNILGIAALYLGLANREAEGRALAATIHVKHPRYGIDDFLSAFHFSSDEARRLRATAVRISLA